MSLLVTKCTVFDDVIFPTSWRHLQLSRDTTRPLALKRNFICIICFWGDIIFCLVASDSARREDHFQKKVCPKRTFPSIFVNYVNFICIICFWGDRIFCLVASDSARREDHFQKKICPKRTFPSNFVKLVSKILYLFLAEKMVVCCCCCLLFVVCCCNFLSDFGLLFF